VGNLEQINVKSGVSVHTQGFPIGSPTTSGDALTLRAGKGKVLGAGSTLYVNSQGGWGIGSYNGADAGTIDYDVDNLNIVSQPGASAITFQGGVRIRYKGDITAVNGGQAFHLRFGATFAGLGSITATGAGQSLLCNTNVRASWSGSILLQDATRAIIVNSSTLSLTACTVDGTNRTAGASLLFDGDVAGNGANTLILTDTSVLGTPGQPVISVPKVILRGRTVVVGQIVSNQLIDERPTPITT
jgi:hypothetical protein